MAIALPTATSVSLDLRVSLGSAGILGPHGSYLPKSYLHSSVWQLYTDTDAKSGDHEIARPLRCGAS